MKISAMTSGAAQVAKNRLLVDDVAMSKSLNRRTFVRTLMQGAAIAPFAARGWRAEALSSASQTLFVGTQTGAGSKGIYTCHWSAEKGELKLVGLAAETDNPTFIALSPDRKHLYAANEVSDFKGSKSGGVSAFSVAPTGKLTAINSVLAEGTGTCHVTTDSTGRAVFCANYNSGSASSFHAESSGALSAAVSHYQYEGHGPDKDRQDGPHAHRVTVSPDNRFLMVNDLGLDCIHIYKLDAATAKLTPNDPPMWKSEPGAGPRALRFHPNGRWAYCVEEMGTAVVVLSWNPSAGSFTTVQRVSIKREGFSGTATGSEIVLTRDGKFAYAADRGDDTVTSFAVDPATGKLTFLARTPCGGQIPRHIALDPTEGWLLVANQGSDTISIIRRDSKTGKLAATSTTFNMFKPQCLVFF
jgi:6-phosphogluconolactonase